MAKADWVRIFGEKIEGAIDGLDGDALADDISEAVDWQELIRTAVAEDPDIRKKLKDKIVKLIEARIKEANDFEDLAGDSDFDWREYLPRDWDIGKIITELLESDEELKEKLREKVQELFLAKLDTLDDDDMPDWDDFLGTLQIEERIREILGSSDELKEKLTSRIRELVNSRIQDGLDEDVLPADLLETVDISAEVNQVLADREFRAQLAEKLREAIENFTMRLVRGSGLEGKLKEKIEVNPEFNSLLERQVGEMMRNPELISIIRNTIMERLAKDSAVGQKLMDIFFEGMAKFLVSKMIKDF